MKFAVSTSKLFYDTHEEIERLTQLGFRFQPAVPHARDPAATMPMRIDGRPTITLSELAALIAFIRDHGGRATLDAAEREIVLLNGG